MASSKRRNRGRKVLVTVLIILAVLIAGGAVAVKVLRDRVTAAYGQKSTDAIQTAAGNEFQAALRNAKTMSRSC